MLAIAAPAAALASTTLSGKTLLALIPLFVLLGGLIIYCLVDLIRAPSRPGSVYIANVPGPPVPLYLAGAPLLDVFPIVPIMGNVPLGIGTLSYAGQFNITVVADRDGCPDAAVFTEGLQAALDALTQAAPVPS